MLRFDIHPGGRKQLPSRARETPDNLLAADLRDVVRIRPGSSRAAASTRVVLMTEEDLVRARACRVGVGAHDGGTGRASLGELCYVADGARRPALPAVSRGLAAQERRGLAAARKDWSAVPPPPRGGRWKLLREAKRGTRWRLPEVTRRSDIRCSRRCPWGGGLYFLPHKPARTVRNSGMEWTSRAGVEQRRSCHARTDFGSCQQWTATGIGPSLLRRLGTGGATTEATGAAGDRPRPPMQYPSLTLGGEALVGGSSVAKELQPWCG